MTIRLKPRMRQVGNRWFCYGNDQFANALTPRDAYRTWSQLDDISKALGDNVKFKFSAAVVPYSFPPTTRYFPCVLRAITE